MDEFFTGLGAVGATCFALSGWPQAWKAWREKHAEGLAHGTLWLWLTGEACMLAYALYFYPNDYIFIVNYTLNLTLLFVVVRYKYGPTA